MAFSLKGKPPSVAYRTVQRSTAVRRVHATAEPAPVTLPETEGAVSVLKSAVKESKFDPISICKAFRVFEQNKATFEDLSETVGGGDGGKHWQLQFVARKGQTKEGEYGGYRFPVTAVQYFDNGVIKNGVYLGHVASLVFRGTYETKKSMLAFVFDNLQIKIGPAAFTFPVRSGSSAEGKFIFFYADDDVFVARGETGGTAFWTRLTPSDQLKIGAA